MFKTYVGLQFDEDGWTAIVGAKLANIKVILPVSGLQNLLKTSQQDVEEGDTTSTHMLKHIAVGLLFLVTQYYFDKQGLTKKKKEAEEWTQNILPTLI